jgi:hypothetical protein
MKKKKKRAEKYEEKLKVKGNFNDLLKELITGKPKPNDEIPDALPKLANPKPPKDSGDGNVSP